jgi:hypothetical protein
VDYESSGYRRCNRTQLIKDFNLIPEEQCW